MAEEVAEGPAAFDLDHIADLGRRHGFAAADRREIVRAGVAEDVTGARAVASPDSLQCCRRQWNLPGERDEIRLRLCARKGTRPRLARRGGPRDLLQCEVDRFLGLDPI